MADKLDPVVAALADIIEEERNCRLAAEREIVAELERMQQRIEDFRNFISQGKDGKDGKDGTPGKDGANGYPGQARGLHDPSAQYRALDVVTLNGCEWRALRDDPGPLPGDGWMRGAKQGSKGDKGERGEPGRPGKDGTGIADIFIDGSVFVVVLTDGRRCEFMLEAAA